MSRAATLSLLVLLLAGCRQESVKQNASPEKPKSEGELAYTTLTERDAGPQGLNLQTRKVEVKPVQEKLALTGWIMAKQGNEVTITAPVAGFVQAGKVV